MTINRAHYRVMVAVLLATGLLLLFCGCGGDDKATSTGPEAPAGGSSGNVSVKGLVDDPEVLTAGRLEEMTVIEITVDHPKLGMTDYRGVRLSDLFASLGVKEGRFVDHDRIRRLHGRGSAGRHPREYRCHACHGRRGTAW